MWKTSQFEQSREIVNLLFLMSLIDFSFFSLVGKIALKMENLSTKIQSNPQISR